MNKKYLSLVLLLITAASFLFVAQINISSKDNNQTTFSQEVISFTDSDDGVCGIIENSDQPNSSVSKKDGVCGVIDPPIYPTF